MVYAPLQRPKGLMAADSATVALAGAAGALTATLTDPFQMPIWRRLAAEWGNRLLGPEQKRRVMRRVAAGTASSAEAIQNLDALQVARWMVSLYPDRQYSGVVIGAPSGAAAHLASLLGWPLLSSHVLCGLKGKFAPDDTAGYVRQVGKVARTLLDRQPQWEGLIHFDPLHDRFLVGDVGFLRLKYRGVPTPIREFMQRNIAPSGQVLVLDCGYPWLQYQCPEVHPSCRLQVGGLGAVSPEEFIAQAWGLNDREPGWQPESEWGTPPTFRDDALNVAESLGLRAQVLQFDHPADLTRRVFHGFQQLWPKAERIYLDCFTHSCPAFNRYARAVPLWLPFLDQESLALASELLAEVPQKTEILLSLHPSFDPPKDLASIADWEKLLEGRQWNWLGVDRATYPHDLGAYGRYVAVLRQYLSSRGLEDYDRTVLELGDVLGP